MKTKQKQQSNLSKARYIDINNQIMSLKDEANGIYDFQDMPASSMHNGSVHNCGKTHPNSHDCHKKKCKTKSCTHHSTNRTK